MAQTHDPHNVPKQERQDEEKPVTIYGMSEVEFNLWKRHPATVTVHKFMKEYESTLTEVQQARINESERKIDLHIEYETRGRVAMLQEIGPDLTFESLLSFYGNKDPANEPRPETETP